VVADPQPAISIPDFVSQPTQSRRPEATSNELPESNDSKKDTEVFLYFTNLKRKHLMHALTAREAIKEEKR
jgi:peptidyl-prolyl cis-trans isomerase SDCCAG10